jgi:hypothetical protein
VASIIEPIDARPPTGEEEKLLAISDYALTRHLYERVNEVMDDDLRDELYFVVGEMLERWAPHVELADRIARADNLADPEAEVEAQIEGMVGRFVARIQRQAVSTNVLSRSHG